jgi:hypothetical protein
MRGTWPGMSRWSTVFPCQFKLSWNSDHCVRSGVSTAVTKRASIFRDVTPCSLVEVCRCSGRTYSLHSKVAASCAREVPVSSLLPPLGQNTQPDPLTHSLSGYKLSKHDRVVNKKFWEDLISYFPLIRHYSGFQALRRGTHTGKQMARWPHKPHFNFFKIMK